jgi:hypothetical protein
VIGVPDDYRGETVKAFVSLEIVDEVPKTVTGKFLRRDRDKAEVKDEVCLSPLRAS